VKPLCSFKRLGRFQSSPVPKDGCNRSARRGASEFRRLECFNPHPSRRTGATLPVAGSRYSPTAPQVSILTRPEGRVQLSWQRWSWPTRVSILTRPEGRVQQPLPPPPPQLTALGTMFQSSPVPKDGCNIGHWRCNRARDCFNPHPSRRTGATDRSVRHEDGVAMFQSSPVPKDGCNIHANAMLRCPGGFNPHPSRRTGATRQFAWWPNRQACCFNPHPSRRTGATVELAPQPLGQCGFNPHPSRRTGATRHVQSSPVRWWRRSSMFQSSPVPKDGCNVVQPR
jgi:hypothetical protein